MRKYTKLCFSKQKLYFVHTLQGFRTIFIEHDSDMRLALLFPIGVTSTRAYIHGEGGVVGEVGVSSSTNTSIGIFVSSTPAEKQTPGALKLAVLPRASFGESYYGGP